MPTTLSWRMPTGGTLRSGTTASGRCQGGPLQSLNTATISSVSVPISQAQSAEPPQSSPRTSDHLPIHLLPVARPPMSNVHDLDLLMAGLGGETIVESPSVPQAPAPTSAAGAVTPTTIYVPGTHGKRKKKSQQKLRSYGELQN